MTDYDDARVRRTMGEQLDSAQATGLRLRKYRKEVLGQTQASLAEDMGIPWGTYVRMEKGECWLQMHKDKLQRIGFRMNDAAGVPQKLSQAGHDRLTADLSRQRGAYAKMLREGTRDMAVLEDVLAATEGNDYGIA